ncbi:hypothetical protein DB346_00870 [Verrucomicrobia bacterium LW23]|nr:hypothetical protein DB346_00870 [Verrucomicrobia bacterium LW23]
MRTLLSPRRWYVQLLTAWCVTWVSLPLHLPVYGNPSGASVQNGSASVSSQGSNVRVQQSSDRAVIHWNDFSIRQGETTTFVQPNSRSATLNRVTGNRMSQLDGTLNANGRMYLVNRNGIVIGKTGRINTAGFTASTHDVSNAEFMKGGDMNFSGNSTAKVINYGKIKATDGDVTLIARQVENHGNITAKNGRAQLAAGTEVLIRSEGAERVFIKPGSRGAAGETGIINTGKVRAAVAELKAAGGNEYALAINNSGVIRATGVRQQGGRVYLSSTGGRIVNSGRIRATNPDGSGGEIRLAAGHIELKRGSVLDASGSRKGMGGKGGKVYVGGEWQGRGTMEQAQTVKVEAGSVIRADATAGTGVTTPANGGTVVLWSTDITDFNGEITARGTNGGLGGNVETSGYRLNVGMDAMVLTEGGTWLLDPETIEIIGSVGTHTSVNGLPPLGAVTIQNSVISTALNTQHVILLASNSITVSADVAAATAGTFNLTLDAPEVFLNAKISMRAGTSLLGGAGTTKVNVGSAGRIQNGIDVVAAGGEVNVAAGTFVENLSINKSLILKGAGNTATILDGSGGTTSGIRVVAGSSTVQINDIQITRSGGTFSTGPGGGINIGAGNNVTINRAAFINNRATTNGGAIYNEGTTTVVDTTIDSNRSLNGAGIYNNTTGVITIRGSFIGNNWTSLSDPTDLTPDVTASGRGGGMRNYGTATIQNSTIYNNKTYWAGGIYNDTGATLNLNSVTIAGNRGDNYVGGIANTGMLNIVNSIIATNTANNDNTLTNTGTLNDQGYNWVDYTTTTLFNNPTSLVSGGSRDPRLSAPANFGGPTLTMMPLAGSGLIGTGSTALTVDQRGLSRTAGSIDRGAYQTRDLGAYVVTTTQDFAGAGAVNFLPTMVYGTLRYGILAGDRYSDINFNIPTSDPGYNSVTGRWVITNNTANTSGFALFKGDRINADTQTGWSATTPVIELNGANTRVVVTNNSATGATVLLNGLYITNGAGTVNSTHGGGVRALSATTEIRNSIITANRTTGTNSGGGGVYVAAGATVNMYDSVVSNNTVSGTGSYGAGIHTVSVLNLFNTTVSGNTITNLGGGIYASATSTVTVRDSTINSNTASSGAGIYAHSIINIYDSFVRDNIASSQGGGLHGTATSTVGVYDTTFSGNRSTSAGGGMYIASSATFEDSILTGSSATAGGGIYGTSTSNLTITDSTISNNSASSTAAGGGIHTLKDATITGSTFEGNFTTSTGTDTSGGAIYMSGGTVSITDSTFRANLSNSSTSGRGGAIFTNGGTLTISETLFEKNEAGGRGGAIYTTLVTPTTITDSDFVENKAGAGGAFGTVATNSAMSFTNTDFTRNYSTSSNGGALYVSFTTTAGSISITGGTFDGNYTMGSGNGGALFATGIPLTVTSTSFTNNTAAGLQGGAIWTQTTLGNITNATFYNNSATTHGGGIFAQAPSLTITGSTFDSNFTSGSSSTEHGGGLYYSSTGGTLNINSSLFYRNRSELGGAITLENGTHNITNTTIVGNRAVGLSGSSAGGGIRLTTGSTLTITNSTITGNTADFHGGGIARNSGGTVTIYNSIVAGNSTTPGTLGSGIDMVGAITDGGFNLIGVGQGYTGAIAPTTLYGTFAVPLDPKLSPLANHGGPTLTMGLLPGSQAINHVTGTAPAVDGRGIARPAGLADIGAFESQGFTYTATSGSGQSAQMLQSFASPLVVTMTSNDGIADLSGTSVTIAVPGSGASATGTLTQTLNASNQASYTLTANNQRGTYDVSVVASPSTVWSLTNAPIILTILPNSGLGKIYGENNPDLSHGAGFTISAGTLLSGDSLVGSLGYAGVGNVGSYLYDLGTLTSAANPNYQFVLGGSEVFTITTRSITIVATPGQSKMYGTDDPTSYAYTVGGMGLKPGDSLAGTLAYTGGPNAGSYAYNLGSLTTANNPNYAISLDTTPVSFTINKRDITVTPTSGLAKLYGDLDPTLTYSITGDGMAPSESLSGALTYSGGPNFGTYAIEQGTLAASTNYNLTFTPGVLFTINKRAITVTPDSGQGKTYGNATLPITYTITGDGMAPSESLSGSLTFTGGPGVGSYAIEQGTLSASTNYTMSFASGISYTISPRSVTVTPNTGQNRQYGDSDPALTYTVGGDGLVTGDNFTGSMSHAGVNVGDYAIDQGSLSLSTNYSLTFIPGPTFRINPRTITVTPNAGQSKMYGAGDPAEFFYTVGDKGLAGGDSNATVFTGGLTRDAGEDAGYYQINQGTLAANGNYAMMFVSSPAVYFTINGVPITIRPDSGQSKYYGFADPSSFTYTITSGSLVGGDMLTGALERVLGENAGSYAIRQGTLAAPGNYLVTFDGSVTFNIAPRPITVTANPGQHKYVGEADPTITYAITSGSLVAGDSLSGSLGRVSGEDAGQYNILPGSLNGNGNYALSFGTPAFFQILSLPGGGQVVVPAPGNPGSPGAPGNPGAVNPGGASFDLSAFNATRGRNNEDESHYTGGKSNKPAPSTTYDTSTTTGQGQLHMSSYDLFGTTGETSNNNNGSATGGR